MSANRDCDRLKRMQIAEVRGGGTPSVERQHCVSDSPRPAQPLPQHNRKRTYAFACEYCVA
eukprot:2243906-Pleurochrysis_carterae.AAC.10